MKDPNFWTIDSLVHNLKHHRDMKLIDGEWVPARPEGFASLKYRLRYTWMVFTGRADVLVWPGQGDK